MYKAKRDKINRIVNLLKARGYEGDWQVEREIRYPSKTGENMPDFKTYNELLNDRKEWAEDYKKYWNEERGCCIATSKDGSKEQISYIFDFKIGKTYYLIRVLCTGG